jgi:S-DNA-T family DNA segregation ATPase FtsK/SpoIIIE
MKDSSVGPVGLLHPNRQKRLLDALAARCHWCVQQQQTLQQKHQVDQQLEESTLADRRGAMTDVCRKQRRELLDDWDASEEQLTAQYEATAVKTAQEIGQLAAIFRKKHQEGMANIERKVEARKQAVLQQYANRKNQPGEQSRKEIKQINDSLLPIHEELEWARALTVRRLDRLPEVPPPASPEENMRELPPASVQESIETIYRVSRKCRQTVLEMQSGAASKIVDSFYLPGAVAVFVVIWIIGVLAFGPKPPWIAMLAGVLGAGLVGFIIYGILLWPLRKMTRRLYPQAERIFQAAEECAATGRKISTDLAAETSAELIQRRDAHLEAAARWRTEQLAELETNLRAQREAAEQDLRQKLEHTNGQYTTSYQRVSAEKHRKAEMLAEQITAVIAKTDQSLHESRAASAAQRHEQLERLSLRLKQGVSRGMSRILDARDQVDQHFPCWQHVLEGSSPPPANIDYVPIGSLLVSDRLKAALAAKVESNGATATLPAVVADAEIPSSLPVVMHRRLHSGVIINAHHSQMNAAIDVAHQILWRLLTGVAAGRAKLTLIDPLGRGQHFTSFMALADHDPTLVGHRVWTSDSKIDERLGEIAHHVEDVLQSSLRDRFERIEDYNELAGSMAEPYRAVAAIGLPEGLSRTAYKHLLALIESGLRCGIFTILVCDQSKPWPGDMPAPQSNKLLRLEVDQAGHWQLDSGGLGDLPLLPAAAPPPAMRNELVERIGTAAVAAARVEIPLDTILAAELAGQGSTADGIGIAVGSQGANRSLSLDLGEGVRQHVLIAGKTGSGKSTLLHSIITSGAHHYRPDQLQFYLLDFKKGVEFKPYADSKLPHARVIGIESEREFGRSVLQRLDVELQRRGEQFRSVGVQELSEYRQASGQSLPRLMLVIDEFQELFVRDDRLAGDCAMLLDRLVRQGRSFGMHVILSSQSLAGAYSLPRATLGQMAVRIALQCSESDAALILSDDNTAARLISRPGEAIYNDAGGLVEGNQPFQVAWLSSARHKEMLGEIAARDSEYTRQLDPPVVFEGNRPCRWSAAMAEAALRGDGQPAKGLRGLLGEAVEIGPPLAVELTRDAGRNILMISPSAGRDGVIASLVSAFAKSQPDLSVIYFDGTRADDAASVMPWLEQVGVNVEAVKPRDCEQRMGQLSELVRDRGDESTAPPILIIIDPLERFRDFRQDESFNFSLDNPGGAAGGATAMRDVLRDGPAANVYSIISCSSAETFGRWLPRSSHHDLELRILGRLNASDSSVLIDSPMASDLTTATMLLYDDADGRIKKFRQADLPDAAAVKTWLS